MRAVLWAAVAVSFGFLLHAFVREVSGEAEAVRRAPIRDWHSIVCRYGPADGSEHFAVLPPDGRVEFSVRWKQQTPDGAPGTAIVVQAPPATSDGTVSGKQYLALVRLCGQLCLRFQIPVRQAGAAAVTERVRPGPGAQNVEFAGDLQELLKDPKTRERLAREYLDSPYGL